MRFTYNHIMPTRLSIKDGHYFCTPFTYLDKIWSYVFYCCNGVILQTDKGNYSNENTFSFDSKAYKDIKKILLVIPRFERDKFL